VWLFHAASVRSRHADCVASLKERRSPPIFLDRVRFCGTLEHLCTNAPLVYKDGLGLRDNSRGTNTRPEGYDEALGSVDTRPPFPA
jgi:hypothetical protein